MKTSWPALIALVVSTAYVGWRLDVHDWDPAGLAEVGARHAGGGQSGSDGYDGQFAYFIALDPAPGEVAPLLDVPAYRYQRILYPLLARALALADVGLIPWALVGINVLAHAGGTWAVAILLSRRGVWPGYALAYGLWVGLVAAVGLDLNEPLAYGLIAVGWLARDRSRPHLSALCVGLSLFAKETALVFWTALMLADILQRRWRSAAAMGSVGLAFAVWQGWLWLIFGSPGLASGGALSTPFEWIPLMGFVRIGMVSLPAFALFTLVFGPTVIAPAILGIVAGVKALRRDLGSADDWAVMVNGLVILFLPFSTFREPLGLVRFSCGLVLATLLYASSRRLRRPLNYAMFWIALLAILLNG